MLNSGLISLAPYLAGAFLAVALTLWRWFRSGDAHSSKPESSVAAGCDVSIFLLRDGKLLNMNFAGRRRLDGVCSNLDDEARLKNLLASAFSDAGKLMAAPEEEADLYRQSKDTHFQIVREVAGRDVRLLLSSRHSGSPGPYDIHSLEAESDELRMLRANIQAAPFLLWRQNAEGAVTWVNRAYLEAATAAHGRERVAVWPMPALFPSIIAGKQTGSSPLKRLQALPGGDGKASWYDCHLMQIDGDTLCTAFPADEAVQSEMRRREFTQTLTKTFADLSIGLAIFDRSRRLVLFNPALTDLTSVASEFLTSRPSLVGFLDQLREKRVMPEPRNYRSWRKSISELEAASVDGTYSEAWSLPDGRTYRVSGRPHPDGAVALLFEDISAEMSLTRHFRAQLEQSNAVIEAVEDALAVFSPSGELTDFNSAYRELWRVDQDERLSGTTVTDATRRWHEKTAPTPVWGDFRDFAFQGRERTEWSALVTLRDGRQMCCRFVPQKAGATLAIFRVQIGGVQTSKTLKEAV